MALTSGRTGQLFGAKTVVTCKVISRAIPEKKKKLPSSYRHHFLNWQKEMLHQDFAAFATILIHSMDILHSKTYLLLANTQTYIHTAKFKQRIGDITRYIYLHVVCCTVSFIGEHLDVTQKQWLTSMTCIQCVAMATVAMLSLACCITRGSMRCFLYMQRNMTTQILQPDWSE